MPFYEYQCSHCGHFFEAMQKISEAPLRKCPSCGRNMLKKLLSAPVFRLKGSGWYETDFKSDHERKRNLAGAEPQPAGSSESTENKAKAQSDGAGEAAAKPAAAESSGGPAAAKPGESGQPAGATAKPPSAPAAPGPTRRTTTPRPAAPRATQRKPPAAKRSRGAVRRTRPARGRR
jgi:putative FmdB family regulatory protein